MSRARSNDSTPGVLFLIVGPSGAGKDSLIDAARARFAGLKDITFIERVITRPSCAGGEAHRGVTAAAFERLYRSGRFILTWSVHGLDYGIPIEVCDAIEGGTSAVVNVSRGVVAEAETLFAQVVVINVTADRSTLRDRLAARGRESPRNVRQRLQRTVSPRPRRSALISICNDGDLSVAADAFCAVILGYITGATFWSRKPNQRINPQSRT